MQNEELISCGTQQYLKTYACILRTMEGEMTRAPLAAGISHNFIVQMLPHHRAAIAMSKNLLHYPVCEPLQEIAEGIITAQTQSIAAMQQALCLCDAVCSSRQALRYYQQRQREIQNVMFSCMRGAYVSEDIQTDFIHEMIPHHLGAVKMSENALQYPICAGLVPILEEIIVSQKEGIRKMQLLL